MNDTTTCATADRWGNVVVATPSGWSGVQAGETGVWLGSGCKVSTCGRDIRTASLPGKRPRITLSPTLVLKDGRPVLAVSVAGGDGQDQARLQAVINQIDFGLSAAASMKALRFGTNHHSGFVLAEATGAGKLAATSRRRKGRLKRWSGWATRLNPPPRSCGSPA